MKLSLVSFLALASTSSAFSVGQFQKKASSTARFYYKDGARYDVIGNNSGKNMNSENQGPAQLQGGAEVDFAMGDAFPETADETSYYIEPEYDVTTTMVMAEQSGVAQVQGGSQNDWSQNWQ